MTSLKTVKDLALQAARNSAPTNFTVEDVNGLLREELGSLAATYYAFNENIWTIFQIMTEVIDEVVPKRVEQFVGRFADIRHVDNGQKVMFHQKVGKNRGKQFLTQAALSGVYETFRLDTIDFEIAVKAYGIAAYIDFERFMRGEEELADFMEVIAEAFVDNVYGLIQKTLRSALTNSARPVANVVIHNVFDPDKMAKLIAVVKSYGTDAIIFAPPEFVAAMGPDAIVPGNAGDVGRYADRDINDIRFSGRITGFRGVQIIELPQSFTDETNENTQIDPQMAYILPTGGEKVVKVVFEGPTILKRWENRDNSMEIQAYRKLGAAVLVHHNWAIYQNTGIPQTYTEPTW